MLYTVSEIIFTAIEGFIFIAAFAILSSQRDFIIKQSFKAFSFVFIYTIYTYWITLFLPTGIHTVFIMLISPIILNYIFRGTIFKSVIKLFSIFVAMSIIETLIISAGVLIFNSPLNSILQNDFQVLLLSIITKIIEPVLLYIFYKRNINIAWLNDSSPVNNNYKNILTIIAFFIFLTVMINISGTRTAQNQILYTVFSTSIYLILIFFVFYAFREGSRLEILQYANDMKKEHIKELIDFNEMVAKERHEYKNHLNTIFGLSTLNKPDLSDKIKHYINNYANNSLTQNLCISSGNDFVDAIINVKYNNAIRKGISVIVDFKEPLSMASLNEDVAVTIISNILDNAFESIASYPRENKYIKLETQIKDNDYIISISNNGPMISEADKKKIFNAGYSTKDNPSKTRGFGLSIVQSVIEKCGGNIIINSTNEVTEFLIRFKINEQQAAI